MWNTIFNVTDFLANITQVLLGISAVVIALTQRKKISTAFSILLGHSLRVSLAEVHHWLRDMQDNRADPTKVRIALAHILGKIKVNSKFREHFDDKILKRIQVMISDLDKGDGSVKETAIITMYSEIQEIIATLEISNQTTNKINSKL